MLVAPSTMKSRGPLPLLAKRTLGLVSFPNDVASTVRIIATPKDIVARAVRYRK
jgi:hypothetical protein